MNTIATYWERRYCKTKRGSGPGSRGERVRQRAEFINWLVAEYHVTRLVDLGCGDGCLASRIRVQRYIGLDVSRRAIEVCEKKMPSHQQRWILYDGWFLPLLPPAELALSIDVIFHLTDDALYRRHLEFIFGLAPLVCIHSTNYEQAGYPHVLHREFLPDVPVGWTLLYRPVDDCVAGFWVFEKDTA